MTLQEAIEALHAKLIKEYGESRDGMASEWFVRARQPALKWLPAAKPTIASLYIEAPPCVKDHGDE